MGFLTSYGYTDDNLVSSVTRSDPATGASYAGQQDTYDAAGNLTARGDGGTVTDYTVNAGSCSARDSG